MTDLSHEGEQNGQELTYQDLPPDGWPQLEFLDIPSAEAQAQLTGNWFTKNAASDSQVLLKDEEVYLPATRMVRIVAGYGWDQGTNEFEAVAQTQVDPSELLHLPVRQGRTDDQGNIVYDRALDGHRALETVRKRGASRPGVSVGEMVHARGGDPKHKIPKEGGWLFSEAPSSFTK